MPVASRMRSSLVECTTKLRDYAVVALQEGGL